MWLNEYFLTSVLVRIHDLSATQYYLQHKKTSWQRLIEDERLVVGVACTANVKNS